MTAANGEEGLKQAFAEVPDLIVSDVMMPVMTAFFTVTLPAGLGLYWIISSVVQILQQLILNAFLDKKGEEIVVTVPEKKQQHRKKRKK